MPAVAAITARAQALTAPLRVAPVRRLWVTQLVSDLADFAFRLALALMVYERTGSAMAVGVATVATMLGWFGPGQVITSWAERFTRRQVMAVTNIVRAAACALAAAPVGLEVLITLAVVMGCAAPPFESARSALRPVLCPPQLLGAAIAVTQVTGDAAMLLGYGLGAGAVAASGATTALVLVTAMYLASAALSAGLPHTEPARGTPPHRLRAAAALITGSPLMRRVLTIVLLTQAAALAADSLLVPYSAQVAQAGPARVGLLACTAAIVCLAVTAALPTDGNPAQLVRRTVVLGIATPVATIAAFAALPPMGGFAAYAAAGTLMVAIVPANVLVSPLLPDAIRSSAFGLIAGAVVAAGGLGTLASTALADLIGPAPAAAALAVPALAYGLWCLCSPLPAHAIPAALTDVLPLPTQAPRTETTP